MAVPGPMVTHSNGAVVPSDTPSVATAKAKFHHAGGNIEPAKASFHPAGGNINSMAGVAPVSSKRVYSGPMAVPGPMVTHENGAVVPADTPAIATARANFHHTGGHVNPMVGMVPVHSKKVYSGPMAVPGPMVTHPNGAVVPEDTPAIATAKANFHQAGGNIKPSVGVPVVPRTYAAAVVSHTNVGVVPVDTAYVKAAKAAHAAAIATAKAKFHQAGGNIDPSVTGMTGVHQGTPVVPGSYAGAVVSHANVGVVPVDTAEVKAAKVAHVAALKQAATYAHHGMVAHKNGAVVPVEPIDIQNIRASHAAAHV